MRTIEMTTEDILVAAKAIPEDAPVFMLNLLRYKENADYGERAAITPCSGREVYYQHYIPAFNEVAAALGVDGITIFFAGSVLASLVAASEERWDDIAIIEYPNFNSFRRVVESSEYQSQADPHRQAALEDWRLLATAKVELPG